MSAAGSRQGRAPHGGDKLAAGSQWRRVGNPCVFASSSLSPVSLGDLHEERALIDRARWSRAESLWRRSGSGGDNDGRLKVDFRVQ